MSGIRRFFSPFPKGRGGGSSATFDLFVSLSILEGGKGEGEEEVDENPFIRSEKRGGPRQSLFIPYGLHKGKGRGSIIRAAGAACRHGARRKRGREEKEAMEALINLIIPLLEKKEGKRVITPYYTFWLRIYTVGKGGGGKITRFVDYIPFFRSGGEEVNM